jgi:hypothetical protein
VKLVGALLLALSLPAWLGAHGGTARGEFERRRALVIGIDGARGDVVDALVWERQQVPALRALMQRGSYARCAHFDATSCARAHAGPRSRSGPRWVTGPGWASVLSGVDSLAGHRHGFGPNRRYLGALREADALLARLIDALELRVRESGEAWLVVLTSDHGGHARFLLGGAHDQRAGPDDAIPFAVAILGAERPQALVSPVTQMDVHPTVLSWLGLPIDPALDGRAQGISPAR